jgi:hypothetical protein
MSKTMSKTPRPERADTPTNTRARPVRRSLATWSALVATAASGVIGVPEARAEGPVTGDGKGIVGGALLGAEVVTIPMGLAGVEPWWPYVVFGSVGAVGGALGGYAVEQAGPPAEAPLYMLAGGLALVIPALVVSLNATTFSDYEDESDPSVEQPSGPPPVVPPAEGGASFQIQSDASKLPKRRAPRAPTARRSATLVGVDGASVFVGVPGVEVKPLYTIEEQVRFGVAQATEVNVPVFAAHF